MSWRVSDAHKNNCCGIHGCRWSEKDCGVILGTIRPGPCRICLNSKYPTEDAYLAACSALWRHRDNEEKLEMANKALKAENVELRKKIRLLRKRNKRQDQIASKSLL